MIWIPRHELEAFEAYNKKIDEDAAKMDWAFRALLQLKAEKGDFDDLEPIIRHRIFRLAYYKPKPPKENGNNN